MVTSVTTVTTLGKGSLTYGGYTHAFSGVSVVCERRGYRGYLVTAVTVMTLVTMICTDILDRGTSLLRRPLPLQPDPRTDAEIKEPRTYAIFVATCGVGFV